ncbi:MAG: aldehyde dehydrogenase family protein [Arthrobacter sp.]|nr:aldehyde dehydrogenase family protein [Arthrobacter sp.]
MTQTLADVRTFELFIGGAYRPASGGTYQIINPSTEEVVGLAPEATLGDVQLAVDAARAAQPGWAALPQTERVRLLEALALRLEEERATLAPLLAAEMGAAVKGTAGMNVDMAAKAFRVTARLGQQELGETYSPRTGIKDRTLFGVTRLKPVGVVAIITAYNAPYVNFSSMAGPALVSGNTVVVKPAPQDPLGVLELGRIAVEAGIPAGVINIINGQDPAIGRELVGNPDVDGVGFTGSPAVGVEIAKTCAQSLKPVLLELGGKGACLVLDDADLDRAVEVLSLTWTFNSGQICGAPSRAIVHSSLKDELVARLTTVAESLKVGPSDDPEAVMGPVISAQHRERIEGFIASATQEGATVATGGKRPDIESGFYAAPTLITDCTSDMKVIREEVFGPVIGLMTFETDDEAVALANDSDYGLVNYVVSRNLARASGVAERLVSGLVNINGWQGGGNGIDEMPFGGRKLSGFGRKGGRHAIEAFTEPMGITVNS